MSDCSNGQMKPYTRDPDYYCPYCGHGEEYDGEDFVGVEFEGSTRKECEECGRHYYVHRSWTVHCDPEEAEPYEAREAEEVERHEEARQKFFLRQESL